MLRKIFIALALTLFCSHVFAAQVFQTLSPAAGHSELTTFFGLANMRGNTNDTPSIKVSGSLVGFGVSYYYGLANGQALGFEAVQTTQIIKAALPDLGDVSQKNKGFNNPVLKYKTLFETSAISFFGQLSYEFGIEKEKEMKNGHDLEGNNADGQNRILFTLGSYFPVNADLTVGSFIEYEKTSDGERIYTEGSTDTVYQITGGGAAIAGFFIELQSHKYKPNISLSHVTEYSTETVSDGITTKEDASNILLIQGVAQFSLSPKLSIVPVVQYQKFLKHDSFEQFNFLTALVNLRLLF